MKLAVLILAGGLCFAAFASFFFAVGAGWAMYWSGRRGVGE